MRRTDIIEQAKAIRAAIQSMGRTATDDVALLCPALFDSWLAGIDYVVGDIRIYNNHLYRCKSNHTSQSEYPPTLIPNLWTAINKMNTGTKEDPIPAIRGMEYQYGLYYTDPEDNKLYLCQRGSETGVITLQYLPHELVGHYFTEVA